MKILRLAFVGGLALSAMSGAALAQLGGFQALFAQLGEISPPGLVHAGRVGDILGVKSLDESGIGAGEEKGRIQNFIGSAAKPF